MSASKRAKTSTAYGAALKYLAAGAAQLPEDSWERRRELTFELELHRAECEFFTGELAAAENRLTLLSACAADTVERAAVACLRIDVCTTRGRMSEAVAVGLECLQHVGVAWTAHPADEEVRREYQRIWSKRGGRAIDQMVDLPLMTDPASLALL